MHGFLTALEFLTPFKIGKIKILPDKELAKSMAWFGVVGLLIGLTLANAYFLLSLLLPKMVVCGFIVLLMFAVTRGLHMDGLADTFDGLTGGKDKTDILRIMHDPATGAIGAAAVFICILIKFSCLYSLDYKTVYGALVVSSVLSRWSFVFSAVKWPAAPDNDGLGRKFIKSAGAKELFWSSLTALFAAIFIFRLKAFFILVLVVILVSLFNAFLKRKIGGLTGDTLGAIGEITEATVLLFALI